MVRGGQPSEIPMTFLIYGNRTVRKNVPEIDPGEESMRSASSQWRVLDPQGNAIEP